MPTISLKTMTLSDNQAIQAIKDPKNRENLDAVKKYESKLRVYTEELDEYELQQESYWTEYQANLKSIVDRKYKKICSYFRYSLPIVQVTDSILNDFYKVYEGKNRFFNVEAERDIMALKDWINDTNLEGWIEKTSREVFKNKPATIIVVDRDKEGKPYLVEVDLNRLIDASIIDKEGNCGHIVFVHSVGEEEDKRTFKLFSVYDDEFYRVYKKYDNADEYVEVVKAPHTVGHCPARLFLKTPSNNKNPFKRRVAFGQSLSKLHDWTTFDVFRNYVDHYAPFPVTEAPVKKCKNPKCVDGKVKHDEVINQATGEKREVWTTCQVCGGKDPSALIGPGTHIGIRLQQDKTKEDGSGKFKMHFPDIANMGYIPEKLENLETEIRLKTVGVNDLLGTEAVNKEQVKGSFASMDNVLMRTKEELDNVYTWITLVVGKLFYPGTSIFVEANHGTEWYLITEEQLQARFDAAKKSGLPINELILIYKQLIDTKYKGNSSKIMREKMLLRLDPLPLTSDKEAVELFGKGVLNSVELSLKINFYKFVTQFEDENTTITEFGTNLEMRDRIKIILETLNKYNDEYIKSKQSQEGDGATGSGEGDND